MSRYLRNQNRASPTEGEKGSSLLEMTLFAPFLILILLLTVQIGALVIKQVQVDAAAREGGRAGAVTMSIQACESQGNQIFQALGTSGRVTCVDSGGYMQATATATVPVFVPIPTPNGVRGGDVQLKAISEFKLEGG